jgi:hypothetical protein
MHSFRQHKEKNGHYGSAEHRKSEWHISFDENLVDMVKDHQDNSEQF